MQPPTFGGDYPTQSGSRWQRLVRAVMTDRSSHRHLWSGTLRLSDFGDAVEQDRIAHFVSGGTEAAISAPVRGPPDDPSLEIGVHQAVRRIFGFRADEMFAADRATHSAGGCSCG